MTACKLSVDKTWVILPCVPHFSIGWNRLVAGGRGVKRSYLTGYEHVILCLWLDVDVVPLPLAPPHELWVVNVLPGTAFTWGLSLIGL